MNKTLYIIDGHYQMYRAFYGAPQGLSTSSGEPTGAIHVFFQMLLQLIRDQSPDYLAVAMDVDDRSVFRVAIDPAYKAQRDPAPEALHAQVDRIAQIVDALGIPILRMPGFEADDLMATVAEQLKTEPIDVYLVSRDKDLHQLISAGVSLFDPTKDQVLDERWLAEEKGYTPQQAVEIQTLTGDATDNIPGVPGVGPKTAAKLIVKYQTAENVLAHADELTPKARERMKAFADQMPITRQLVTLRRDAPLDFDLTACRVADFDAQSVLPLFEELEMNRLAEQISAINGKPAGPNRPGNARVESPAPRAAPSAPEEAYLLIDTPELLETFVAELAKQERFAFDTETTGLNPVAADLVGVSVSWQSGAAAYIPVRGIGGPVLPISDVVAALKPAFENPNTCKTGHNLKYDLLVMRQAGIETAGVFFDTMIASFLVDPLRNSHSLDNLTRSLLGHEMIPISDLIGKGKQQITIDQVDTTRVGHYAAEDADYTWRLYELLAPKIQDGHVQSLFEETEMPLVSVLAEMEHHGVAIDATRLAAQSERMADQLDALQLKVFAAAGHEFNMNSTKQLATVLFDEQGLPVTRKTKTGRSTDAATLQSLVDTTDHPIPKLLLEYREIAKLKSTYVDTLPKMVCERTRRIHASFHQTGTATGRLSSSDPNLQNIPIRTPLGRSIRSAFVAGAPDRVLLAADYSQIELRLLAHFCKDAALVAAFESGQDIHRTVAASVNGVSLDKVTPEQRSAAKAVNFGIIYGQTAFGLSRSVGMPVGEARAFIDMYFMRYPGIRLFIDECIGKAKKLGYAETILGRRRPIPELTSRNRQQIGFGERIAVNTVVQGSAADLIKRAMLDIHRELKTGRYHAKMLIQVHDELVFELPESAVAEESEMVRARMEDALPLDIPIVVDIAWGRNWAEGK
ncbi:MAG: DNA polymerase I [Phycisphaerae bacterium]